MSERAMILLDSLELYFPPYGEVSAAAQADIAAVEAAIAAAVQAERERMAIEVRAELWTVAARHSERGNQAYADVLTFAAGHAFNTIMKPAIEGGDDA